MENSILYYTLLHRFTQRTNYANKNKKQKNGKRQQKQLNKSKKPKQQNVKKIKKGDGGKTGQFDTEEKCIAYVNEYVYNIKNIPKSKLTERICCVVVAKNGLTYDYIPVELQTPSVVMALVSTQGRFLRLVNPCKRTAAVSLAAVSNYGLALGDVPPDVINENICVVALKNNLEAHIHVPDHLFTKKLFDLTLI